MAHNMVSVWPCLQLMYDRNRASYSGITYLCSFIYIYIYVNKYIVYIWYVTHMKSSSEVCLKIQIVLYMLSSCSWRLLYDGPAREMYVTNMSRWHTDMSICQRKWSALSVCCTWRDYWKHIIAMTDLCVCLYDTYIYDTHDKPPLLRQCKPHTHTHSDYPLIFLLKTHVGCHSVAT